MKNIKITLEGPYELDVNNARGSFGVSERDIWNLKEKCFEFSNEDKPLTRTDLLIKVIEEGLITGPVGLTLLTIGLQEL